jgi:putative Mn2+ efflux pump MntP
MNVVGAGIGRLVEGVVGEAAAYAGFAALVCVGIYMIIENIRESESALDLSHGWGLLTAALAISLDSLGIGFSIVYIGIPLFLSLSIIAGVSVVCSSLGLFFGRLLGRRVEESVGVIAGVMLIATGLLFAFMRYRHIE